MLVRYSQKHGQDEIAGSFTRLICHGWTTSGMRYLVIRRNMGRLRMDKQLTRGIKWCSSNLTKIEAFVA